MTPPNQHGTFARTQEVVWITALVLVITSRATCGGRLLHPTSEITGCFTYPALPVLLWFLRIFVFDGVKNYCLENPLFHPRQITIPSFI